MAAIFLFVSLCWVFTAMHGLSLIVGSGSYSLLRSEDMAEVASLLSDHGLQSMGFSSCGTWA